MSRVMMRAVLLFVAGLLSVACGGGSGGDADMDAVGSLDTSPGGNNTKTAVIGAAGGTIDLGDGARLTIPAGALSSDTTIRALRVEDAESDHFSPVGPFFQFEPTGLTFARPATLALPYDAARARGATRDRLMVVWSEDGSAWHTWPTAVDELAHVMTAPIAHFSQGGAGLWRDPTGACCSGETCSQTTFEDCGEGAFLGRGVPCEAGDLSLCATAVCCEVHGALQFTTADACEAPLPQSECELVCCASSGVLDDAEVVAAGDCEADSEDFLRIFAPDGCGGVCCQIEFPGAAWSAWMPSGLCDAIPASAEGYTTQQTEDDASACDVCCRDDYTIKPFADCEVQALFGDCDPTCCAYDYVVIPTGRCPIELERPSERCEDVCCLDEEGLVGEVMPAGLCEGDEVFGEDVSRCEPVCCTYTDLNGQPSAFWGLPKLCEHMASTAAEFGFTVSDLGAEDCIICCSDDWERKPTTDCHDDGHTLGWECDRICCDLGEGQFLTLPDGACTRRGGEQAYSPDLCDGCEDDAQCDDGEPCTIDACDPSTGRCSYVAVQIAVCGDGCVVIPEECESDADCAQQGPDLRCLGCECKAPTLSPRCQLAPPASQGRQGVAQGRLTATSGNDEGNEGCEDHFTSVDDAANKAAGPDAMLEIEWPPGDVGAVVAAVQSSGFASSVQIKAGCAAADPSVCLGSSWGGSVVGWPFPSKPGWVFKPYGTRPWWSGATYIPDAPSKAAGDTIRFVVDSWPDAGPAGGDSIDGDFTLYWKVLDGDPPPHDTAAGALPVGADETIAPESLAFATDTYQTAGCLDLPDGLGAGSPDVFYAFTPEADGVFIFEVGLINELAGDDAFIAVQDADGACIAAVRGGEDPRVAAALVGGHTYTTVVDLGLVAPSALYVYRQRRVAGGTPTNYACDSAAPIEGLPFSVQTSLAEATDDFTLHPDYQPLIPAFGGWRDLVWSYTPSEDEWVRFTLTSRTEAFAPYMMITDRCDGGGTVSPIDAFGMSPDEGTASITRRLSGGTTYWIIVDGGNWSMGDFTLELGPGANEAPDGCANPLVVTTLPAEIRVDGRNLTDRFSASAATPEGAEACVADGVDVGAGLPDAVLAYTATADGTLSVEVSGGTPAHVYAVAGSCTEGVQTACAGPVLGDGEAYARLATGETAYVILDGWASWSDTAVVSLGFTPQATNETCASAAEIALDALPYTETTSLMFATDDIRNDDSAGCTGLLTAGGDLVWRIDPGGAERSFAAAVFDEGFAWTLYAVTSCDANPNPTCLGGANEPGYREAQHVVLPPRAEPFYLVLDHSGLLPGTPATLQVQEITTPPNDTCETALTIDTLPFEHVGNNILAAADYGLPGDGGCGVPFATAEGPDVVYRLVITQALLDTYRFLNITTEPNTFDLDLLLLLDGCDPTTDCVSTNGDMRRNILLEEYAPGDVLYIIVSGSEPSRPQTGFYTLRVSGAEDVTF